MIDLVSRDGFRPDRLDLFWRFICERQLVWHRRCVQCLPPPWTNDPILQSERFTNVYRELDPGTHYAIQHILEVDAPKPDKIFNVMLYRLVGRSETHAALGFQRLADFDPTHFRRILRRLRDVEGTAPFTAAYMVSAYSHLGAGDKIDSVAHVLTRLHAGFPDLYGRIEACQGAEAVYAVLRQAYGFGNFLAYQVLIDLLYPLNIYDGQPLLPYTHDDWASAGPGAQRGIRMLLREGTRIHDLNAMRWLRAHQHAEFARLDLDFPCLHDASGHALDLSLANIQNCLCEYHKYVKISDGTGRGKRKFRADAGMQLPLPALVAATSTPNVVL